MKIFNLIDKIANIMYVYPIKTFVYLVVLNMLYFSTTNFILAIVIFLIWSFMTEAYVISRIAKKYDRISSLEVVLYGPLFDFKIIMTIIISVTLYILVNTFIQSFILRLIGFIISSFIMTLGHVIIIYKHIEKKYK